MFVSFLSLKAASPSFKSGPKAAWQADYSLSKPLGGGPICSKLAQTLAEAQDSNQYHLGGAGGKLVGAAQEGNKCVWSAS